MDPRLRLDIGWSDLFGALAPGRGGDAAAVTGSWPKASAAFLSVRTAFDALLQALAVAPGQEIVMSAVNIESMAEIAETHGVKLVPVDIDIRSVAPSPESVRAALTERTRIILIAHLFGARVPLAPYAAMKPESVVLVEDCAQGWGGGYRGAVEADVSLFSFGPIKRRTALGGAVAAFSDDALAARCVAIQSGYPRLGEGWFRQRIAKYMALKAVSTPAIYGAAMGAVGLATGDVERAIGAAARGFPKGDLIRLIRKRPPAGLLRLLAKRLSQPEDDAARIAAARDVLGALDRDVASIGAAARAHHYWLAPILVDEPGSAVRMLRALGFDATRGATSLRALSGRGRAVPNAERLMQHVLYLPPPWSMSTARRLRLIEVLRSLHAPAEPATQMRAAS